MSKKLLSGSFLILLLLLANYSWAGGDGAQVPTRSLFFNNYQIALGVDNDHYGSMSLDRMMYFAKYPYQMQRDLSGFTEEINTTAYGMALYVNLGFSPLNKKIGEYRENREVRFGMGFHSPKEAMLSYKDASRDTSIVYCNIQSEITIEGSYIFKGDWGRKWMWRLGFGGSIGTTFNNSMMLIHGRYYEPGAHPTEQPEEDIETETFRAKNVSYLRAYLIAGISYKLGEKWAMGFEYRRGCGVQLIGGSDPHYLQRTGSFMLGVSKRFR